LEVNGSTTKLPQSKIDQHISKRLGADNSLDELLQQLHPSLKCLLGKVVWPEDAGLGVSEAIVKGVCIRASDGSLITSYRTKSGAYGYAIRGRSNAQEIVGYGSAPLSNMMSSMTTESYGLIGLLILLHVVCIKYSLCREECFGEVIIYIDNKTVVERGNKAQDLINLSDYRIPDQDLWSLTTDLIRKLPIAVKIEWIKGHQDLNKNRETINGPYSNEVQLNILTDELAKKGMKLGKQNTTRRPNLSSTVLSLYNSSGKYISDLRKYTMEHVNGNRMLDYMLEKEGGRSKCCRQLNGKE
jgi:ribonuclease HI